MTIESWYQFKRQFEAQSIFQQNSRFSWISFMPLCPEIINDDPNTLFAQLQRPMDFHGLKTGTTYTLM